jgi:16S rRNA (cytosine1402-N4)-methyltransferase
MPAGGPVRHIPVLLSQVLAALKPADGERYIDATFGAGGYTRAILEAADCTVLAIDRDPSAMSIAEAMRQEFGGRLLFSLSDFAVLHHAAGQYGLDNVDGVVFDLGVSSMQLDEPGRGFSFMRDGPLDMRMSRTGESAADIVNGYGESELADIFYKFGEERRSRAIAAAIVKARAVSGIETTGQLADIVSAVLGRRHDDTKHPATRSFQALRLFVNDELGQLQAGLLAAEALLKPGGRLLAVTFHSLEDRIVKQFFLKRAGKLPGVSRYQPEGGVAAEATFELTNRHGIAVTEEESRANPRARSARLRWGIRKNTMPDMVSAGHDK